MGQGQNPTSNPILKEWQAHPTQTNTYINTRTQEQAQSHLVSLGKNQQSILRKRMQENHNFVVKVLYFEPAFKNRSGKEQPSYYVYTEKTYPLSKSNYVPLTFSLSILKGFRRLSSNYGLMRISPAMIKVNDKNQVRVWINENPVKCELAQGAESEEQLLADIVKIIMDYDAPTGALMMKCTSINEAINNILHSMTESKNAPHLSNRTSKNEDRAKISKEAVGGGMQPKNNFRSTKQTEDDSLKPFNDSGLKYQRNETLNIGQPEGHKNYMQNVVVPKPPTYINVDRVPGDPRSFGAPVRNPSEDIGRDMNYSQQNNMQKQSSIQFNSSHPAKMVSSCRPYKPVDHKNANHFESINNSSAVYSQQFSPTYQRPHREPDKYSEKYSEVISKAQQYSVHQPERKSNLNKNYLERMETSQESEFGSYPKTKGSFAVEKAEINTSRQFMESHSFNRPRYGDGIGGHFDSGRTKTQEFYTSNTDMLGTSPRIRTNYLQQNSQISKAMLIQSGMVNQRTNAQQKQRTAPYANFNASNNINANPNPNTNVNANGGRQGEDEEEKKQVKLKQAQKIKQEMSSLGILNTSGKQLASDKSNRDLLIKQKIEEKNKKHEELKFAITRLLSE